MEYTVAVVSRKQLDDVLDTPAHYIRFGEVHCWRRADYQWPKERIRESIAAVLEAGKVPQFQLLLPSSSGREYRQMSLDLLEEFPLAEVVLGHWGALLFPLRNRKLASCYLNIYNSGQMNLAWRRGAGIISLPGEFPLDEAFLSQRANFPKELIFEYQVWGSRRLAYLWSCREDKCKPERCGEEENERLTHSGAGSVRLAGNILWDCEQVDKTAFVKRLARMEIQRGLIQLDYREQDGPKTVKRCLQKIEGIPI